MAAGDFSAKTPGELKTAIRNAFAADGRAIVDANVVPDELPNLPHLDLKLLGHWPRLRKRFSPFWRLNSATCCRPDNGEDHERSYSFLSSWQSLSSSTTLRPSFLTNSFAMVFVPGGK